MFGCKVCKEVLICSKKQLKTCGLYIAKYGITVGKCGFDYRQIRCTACQGLHVWPLGRSCDNVSLCMNLEFFTC